MEEASSLNVCAEAKIHDTNNTFVKLLPPPHNEGDHIQACYISYARGPANSNSQYF